jgi:DNA-binding transcriptional ArsR family regulator
VGATATSAKKRRPDERTLVKALSHPLRVRILALLNVRIASPSWLAYELGETLGNVSYHVGELVRFDCIELVRTEAVRGTTKHYYRATRRPYFDDAEWKRLPVSARQAVSGTVVQMIFDEFSDSAAAGKLDERTDRHLSRSPLILDELAWTEMNEILTESLDRVLRLQAAAKERIGAGEAQPIYAAMILAGFETEKPE